MTSPAPVSRIFLDALGGLDGTQAVKVRYAAPPVFPDAALGVAPAGRARPGPRARPMPRSMPMPAAVSLAPRPVVRAANPGQPVRARQVPPAPRTAAPYPAQGRPQGVGPRMPAPYGAGQYQGPVPAAFAQQASSPSPFAFTPPAPAARSPRNFRQPPTPTAPPKAPVKKRSYLQGIIFLIVFALIGSGAGKAILDALFNR